jgi:hypothetical protein
LTNETPFFIDYYDEKHLSAKMEEDENFDKTSQFFLITLK